MTNLVQSASNFIRETIYPNLPSQKQAVHFIKGVSFLAGGSLALGAMYLQDQHFRNAKNCLGNNNTLNLPEEYQSSTGNIFGTKFYEGAYNNSVDLTNNLGSCAGKSPEEIDNSLSMLKYLCDPKKVEVNAEWLGLAGYASFIATAIFCVKHAEHEFSQIFSKS